MSSIFKSNQTLKKVGSRLFSTTPSFTIINTDSAFLPLIPQSINGPSYLKFVFNQPTSVLWKRGDGTSINIPTTDMGDGTHVVQFWKPNSSGLPTPTGALAMYNYGSSATRILNFEFDRILLINLELNNIVLPNQLFNIPFSEYPNLKVLKLEVLNNSITGLRLEGITNSVIEELYIRASVQTSSQLYSVIPAEISLMPLKTLSISGNYSNYSTSNAALIGNIITLKNLTFSSSFSQTDGLPDSFTNLTNLESFKILSVLEPFNITSLPIEITSFTKLKILNFANNQTALSITQIGFSLDIFPDLEELSLAYNINTFTNFNFISQLQSKIKTIDLRGISNLTYMNTVITNLYNLVNNNASKTGDNTLPYRGIRVRLESYNSMISASPTGTYQQPTGYVAGVNNGSPASSKERIWVLNNQYGCNITY